jgi:hypothetical protein
VREVAQHEGALGVAQDPQRLATGEVGLTRPTIGI